MNSLDKRVVRLQYVTIAWNTLEGLGSIALGLLAHSISLVAFGLESGLEVAVSALVLWHMYEKSDARERTALLAIGWIYIAVSVYIFADVVQNLLGSIHEQRSLWAIAFLGLTVIVMATLSLLKYRLGKETGDKPLMADARFSIVDASLAGAVLIGLVLTATFGWWWTDDVLAAVIACLALREGLKELTTHWLPKKG
ncbi:MAG TPA: cation transporter [Candidatus Paceibacterota bacterium]|nr:cation transporter [Candidatus Paceibacterota bacterium]